VEMAKWQNCEIAKLKCEMVPSNFAISPFFNFAISVYDFASFQFSPTPTSTSNGTLSGTA
jgi:hypothetical protein